MKNQKAWQNVLPITLLVVIVGLGLALFWFSPANQAQLAYTSREPAPTKTWSELYGFAITEYVNTPNTDPQVFHLEEGEHELIIRGREPESLLDKVQVIKVEDASATAAAWTPTPFPICTAVSCNDGQLFCPGDCLGGCGMVCVPNTPTVTPVPLVGIPENIEYEIVDRDVDVRIKYLGVGSSGLIGGLNERNDATLYSFSVGYRLPSCELVPQPPDQRYCSEHPTHLYYVIHVTAGLPYDLGYWGMFGQNNWIILYRQRTKDWFIEDWRP